jgi:hypothetical protein
MDLSRISDTPCPAGAIGIAVNSNPAQPQHSGLLFEHRSGAVMLCDFMNHENLAVRQVPPDYFWTPVRLTEHQVAQVAAFIQLVVQAHASGRRLSYSFMYSADAFDVTGSLRQGVPGLTCATFIVAIFERLKLSLIDASTWRERKEEDQAARMAFIAGIVQTADEATVIRLMAEKPDFRIKPYEVCGAATHYKYPVGFIVAKRLASEVSTKIKNWRPKPP